MVSGNPIISVIVTFFNIQECVSYCVESLLAQRFSDYEVICVDDGSTDKTLLKLNQYGTDSKVTVLHKENGGISTARNFGVEHARGNFISFVDGDDVVSPHYLEFLFSALGGEQNAMAVSPVDLLNEASINKPFLPIHVSKATYREVTHNQYFHELMYEKTLPGAWARLAPKAIYEKVPFPVGKAYEDIMTAPSLALEVEHIFMLDQPVYGYIMRPGSIVHRKVANMKQADDYLFVINFFSGTVSHSFPNESKEQVFFRALHYSRLFRLLDVVVDNLPDKRNMQKTIISYVKAHLSTLLVDDDVSKGNKLRFFLLSYFPGIFRLSFNLYNKLKRGM